MAVNSSQNFEISVRIPSLCRTVRGDLCTFPFTYKNVQYTECTYTDSLTPWCATMLDADGKVIQNRWGDCDVSSRASSCPVSQQGPGVLSTTTTTTTTSRPPTTSPRNEFCYTVGGPDPGKACNFPFRHDGKWFTECTSYGLGEMWCSTRTRQDGSHIQGQGYYGLCSKSCPGMVEPITPTTPASSCTDGQSWRRDCNTCVCDGGQEFCTDRRCDVECEAGDTWQDQCNTCICTSQRKSVCTEKKCDSGCTPDSGPGAGLPCVFPFTWNKVTYTACAPWIWSGQHFGKFWCSTKVDRDGNHIDGEGKYGFCPQSCNDPQDETRVDYFPVFDAIFFPKETTQPAGDLPPRPPGDGRRPPGDVTRPPGDVRINLKSPGEAPGSNPQRP